jgi:hypothetical protein
MAKCVSKHNSYTLAQQLFIRDFSSHISLRLPLRSLEQELIVPDNERFVGVLRTNAEVTLGRITKL